jgi:hypothetical protein
MESAITSEERRSSGLLPSEYFSKQTLAETREAGRKTLQNRVMRERVATSKKYGEKS